MPVILKLFVHESKTFELEDSTWSPNALKGNCEFKSSIAYLGELSILANILDGYSGSTTKGTYLHLSP